MHKWFDLMFVLFLAAGLVLLPIYSLLLSARAGTGFDLAPWDVLVPSSVMAIGTWSLSFACSLAYLYTGVLSQLSHRRERLLLYRSGGSLGYVVVGLCLGLVVPISPTALLLASFLLPGMTAFTWTMPTEEAESRNLPGSSTSTIGTLVRRFGWDIVLLAIALPLTARGYEIFACLFLLATGVHWPTAILVSGVVVEACLLASLPRFFSAHDYYRVFVLSAGWIEVYAGLADLNGIGAVAETILSNLTTKAFDQFHWVDTWTGLWIVSLLIAVIPFAVWLVSNFQRRRTSRPLYPQ